MRDYGRIDALIDGRVSEQERDELYTRLLDDDFAYRLFTETVGVLHDLETARTEAEVASPDVASSPSALVNDDPVDADAADPPSGAGDPPPVLDPPAAGMDDGVIPLASRRRAEHPPAGATDDPPAPAAHGVIPLESRRRPGSRRWIAYGAIAAGIVAIALTAGLLRRTPASLDDPARAVRLLDDGSAPGLASGWDEPWRNNTRGRGGSSRGFTRLSLRLGTHLVDLELAVAARDTAVQQLSNEIAEVLQDTSMHGAAVASEQYREIALKAAAGDFNLQPLLADGRHAVQSLVDPDWLELGIWAETARTAAVRHDADFFDRRASRAALERFDMLSGMDGQERTALAEVRRALPRNGTANWPALEDALSELLFQAGR